MKIIEKYGKTEEEALTLALKEAGIEKSDDIKYEVVKEEHKTGFLGIGGNKTIKVQLFTYDDDEKKIINIIHQLFNYMEIKIEKLQINKREDERIFMDIETPDTGIVIGKKGRTLEAIQLIASLIVSKELNKNFYLILDTAGYREKRVQTLEQIARNLALKVRKYRRPFTLEPMNPYERRIIHSTLQEEKDIITQSIGNGNYKKVKILLKR